MGLESKVRTRTPTYYLDFNIKPGASFSQPIPKGWTTFAYTLDGTVKFSKMNTNDECGALFRTLLCTRQRFRGSRDRGPPHGGVRQGQRHRGDLLLCRREGGCALRPDRRSADRRDGGSARSIRHELPGRVDSGNEGLQRGRQRVRKSAHLEVGLPKARTGFGMKDT